MAATAVRSSPTLGSLNYLNEEQGLRSWLATHDHKRIGLMFLVLTSVALAIGGAFAMVMRLELLTPGGNLVSAETYNRLFTLHGITMVWLFMIPSIPAV